MTNWTTAITGPEMTACTATTATGRYETLTVGQIVRVEVTTMCPDGGAVRGYRYVAIERMGRGTEYGMIGTTMILEVTADGRKIAVAARCVEVVVGAAAQRKAA